jgi:hypothetical protein
VPHNYDLADTAKLLSKSTNNRLQVSMSFNTNINLNDTYNPTINPLTNGSITLLQGNRVLLYGQIDETQNGVYVLSNDFTLTLDMSDTLDLSVIDLSTNKVYWCEYKRIQVSPTQVDYVFPVIGSDVIRFKEGGDYVLQSEFEYTFLNKSNVIGSYVFYDTNTIYTHNNVSYQTRTPNTVWYVGQSGLIVRHDYTLGNVYTAIRTLITKDIHDIFFRNNLGWMVGVDGLIARTTDGGDNWDLVKVTELTNETLRSVYFISDTQGIIVGDRGTILVSVNAGVSWTKIEIPESNLRVQLNCVKAIRSGNQTLTYIIGNRGTFFRYNWVGSNLTNRILYNKTLLGLSDDLIDIHESAPFPYIDNNNRLVFSPRWIVYGNNGDSVLSVTPSIGSTPSNNVPDTQWEVQIIQLPGMSGKEITALYLEPPVPSLDYPFSEFVDNPLTAHIGAIGSSLEYWFPPRIYCTTSNGEIIEHQLTIPSPVSGQLNSTLQSNLNSFYVQLDSQLPVSFLYASESGIFQGSVIIDNPATRPYSVVYSLGDDISHWEYTRSNINSGLDVQTIRDYNSLLSQLKNKALILDYYLARTIQSDLDLKGNLTYTGTLSYVLGDGSIVWSDETQESIKNLLAYNSSISPLTYTYETYFGNLPTDTSITGWTNINLSVSPFTINLTNHPSFRAKSGDVIEIKLRNAGVNEEMIVEYRRVVSFLGNILTLDSALSDDTIRLLSNNTNSTRREYNIRNTNLFIPNSPMSVVDLVSQFKDWLNNHVILSKLYRFESDGINLLISKNLYYGSVASEITTSSEWSVNQFLSYGDAPDAVFTPEYSLYRALNEMNPVFNSSYEFKDYSVNNLFYDSPVYSYNTPSLTILDNNRLVSDDPDTMKFEVGTFIVIVNNTTQARSSNYYFIKAKEQIGTNYILHLDAFEWIVIPSSGFSYSYTPVSNDAVYIKSSMRLDELSIAFETSDNIIDNYQFYTEKYARMLASDYNIRDNVSLILFSFSANKSTGLLIIDNTDVNLKYTPSTLYGLDISTLSPIKPISISKSAIEEKKSFTKIVNPETSGVYEWVYSLEDGIHYLVVQSGVYYLLNVQTRVFSQLLEAGYSNHKQPFTNPLYPSNQYFAFGGDLGLKVMRWDGISIQEVISSDIDNILPISFDKTRPINALHYLSYTQSGNPVHRLWIGMRYIISGNVQEELGWVVLGAPPAYTIYKRIENPSYVRKSFVTAPDNANLNGYQSEIGIEVRRIGSVDRVYLHKIDTIAYLTPPVPDITIDNTSNIEVTWISQIRGFLSSPLILGSNQIEPSIYLNTSYPNPAQHTIWLGSNGANAGMSTFISEYDSLNSRYIISNNINYKKSDSSLQGSIITSLNQESGFVYFSSERSIYDYDKFSSDIRIPIQDEFITHLDYDANNNEFVYTLSDGVMIPSSGIDLDISTAVNKPILTILGGFREIDIITAAPWLLSADIQNAVVTLTPEGRLIWYSGDWFCGTWENGIWYSGNWYGGIWKAGEFYSYEVNTSLSNPLVKVDSERSRWYAGKWEDGNWYNGTWYSGIWVRGIHHDGFWYDGCWLNGQWLNGEWYGGIWYEGFFRNGIMNQDNVSTHWYAGIFSGGDFQNGTWYNGIFYQENIDIHSTFGTRSSISSRAIWLAGIFRGGEIWSGRGIGSGNIPFNIDNKSTLIYSGNFEAGVIYGGKWYLGNLLSDCIVENLHWVGYRAITDVSFSNNTNSGLVFIAPNTIISGVNEGLPFRQSVLGIKTGSDFYLKGRNDTYTTGYEIAIAGEASFIGDYEPVLGLEDEYATHKVLANNGKYIFIPFEEKLNPVILNYNTLRIVSLFSGGEFKSGVIEDALKKGGVISGGNVLKIQQTNGLITS